MKVIKPKFWSKINLFSLILLPLSLITLLIYFLKKIAIKSKDFKIPVICVGNIYVGGTGKTPLSIYIVNFLRKKKFKPALIRKYYKSHLDEITLTKSKVSNFFVDKKRITSLIKAKRASNNIVVMDDGLQDLSLKKKVNVVCFNSTDSVGNGFLLPAGPLREPLSRLNDNDIVVINGKKSTALETKIKKISKKIKFFYSKYSINKSTKLKKNKIFAFAGIGNPHGFFELLRHNKFNVKSKLIFPDHHDYKKQEVTELINIATKKKFKVSNY